MTTTEIREIIRERLKEPIDRNSHRDAVMTMITQLIKAAKSEAIEEFRKITDSYESDLKRMYNEVNKP